MWINHRRKSVKNEPSSSRLVWKSASPLLRTLDPVELISLTWVDGHGPPNLTIRGTGSFLYFNHPSSTRVDDCYPPPASRMYLTHKLSAEIVVMIYSSLPTFDDGINLSATCKPLRNIWVAHGETIMMEMAVNCNRRLLQPRLIPSIAIFLQICCRCTAVDC